MLKVRLQRTGKRGQAYFRVVAVEHTKKPKGEFLDLLGSYDPHKKELKVDMEKLNGRVSKGAQVSPTVNNLLVNYKYWDKPKVQSWKPKNRGNTEGAGKAEEAQKEISASDQAKTETKTEVDKTEAPATEQALAETPAV